MTDTIKAKRLGAKIRAHRKQNKMTQEEFGALFRADQALVSKWESGKSVPGTVHAASLVKMGVCTLDECAAAAGGE